MLWLSGGRVAGEAPPGLAAFSAPRRSARGREQDALFLCLGLRSRAPIPPERYTELIELAAATFYGSSGSITSALRQALAAVNARMLDANVRDGAPVQGGLICAGLRGAELYAVHGGPGLLIAAHPQTLEHSPAVASRPLGLSDALDAQYFHTTVSPGEYFLLSPAAQFDAARLAGLGGLSTVSAAIDRLAEAARGDVVVLLGRFEPGGSLEAPLPQLTQAAASPGRAGSGDPLRALTSLLRSSPRAEPPAATEPAADLSAPAAQPQAAAHPPEAPAPESTPPVESVEAAAPDLIAAPEPEGGAGPPAPTGTDWQGLLRRAEQVSPTGEPAPEVHVPIIEADDELPEFRREAAGDGRLAAFIDRARLAGSSFARAVAVTLSEAWLGLRRLIGRALPEGMLQENGLLSVPPAVMVGLSAGVAVLIIAVAVGAYIQTGRRQQFDSALNEAKRQIVEAEIHSNAGDVLATRSDWVDALAWLDQAETFQPGNAEVVRLRGDVEAQLDQLDWASRLGFQPLVSGGLGPTVQLTRLALNGRDVYALDGPQNRIYRLTPTNSGRYIVDPDFECRSGRHGQYTVGTLIDLMAVPAPNAIGADAVVALDSLGALMYCAPNNTPLVSYLVAPDIGWIQPLGMELYANRLYVLDVGNNQIWQFDDLGGAFLQSPTGYFTQAVYDLRGVIDFTIATGDVILWRGDGRASLCGRSAANQPATCDEAVTFADERPGRGPGPRLAEITAPRRLVYDPPPEPSLYLLDGEASAVYQLSLKFNFVRQFRPGFALAGPITDVAIDAAKHFFVTAGDNVYEAARP